MPSDREQNSPASAEAVSAGSTGAGVAEAGFSLSGAVRGKLSLGRLAEWEKVYQTGRRQLRNWWNEGAPLGDAEAMPAWWEGERAAGKKSWSVPDKITAAAVRAREARAVAEPSAVPTVGGAAADGAAGKPTGSAVAAINLEDFDPDEGDRLRELKQIQAARFEQLRLALRAGTDTTLLEQRYVKLCDMLDKMESRVAERLKKRGLFVLRPEIERDVAKAADMIRQMGESEVRRVLELVPDLPPAFRDQVAAAIRRMSSARAGVFRMLKSLRVTEDAVFQLAAA